MGRPHRPARRRAATLAASCMLYWTHRFPALWGWVRGARRQQRGTAGLPQARFGPANRPESGLIHRPPRPGTGAGREHPAAPRCRVPIRAIPRKSNPSHSDPSVRVTNRTGSGSPTSQQPVRIANRLLPMRLPSVTPPWRVPAFPSGGGPSSGLSVRDYACTPICGLHGLPPPGMGPSPVPAAIADGIASRRGGSGESGADLGDLRAACLRRCRRDGDRSPAFRLKQVRCAADRVAQRQAHREPQVGRIPFRQVLEQPFSVPSGLFERNCHGCCSGTGWVWAFQHAEPAHRRYGPNLNAIAPEPVPVVSAAHPRRIRLSRLQERFRSVHLDPQSGMHPSLHDPPPFPERLRAILHCTA